MEILVLEHEPEAPAGLLADWAGERGHTLRVLEVPALARWPEPTAADAIVSLGAESSVHGSTEDWIARELDFLRLAHVLAVPVLGICFGAQALAAALGGEVTRAPRPAVEWSTLERSEEALIPRGPWLRWHEDVFTVPPGARELAGAGGVPLAFAAARSVAVQFHPEADAAIARGWIASSRERVRELPDGLRTLQAQLEGDEEGARERASDLFDRVVAYWWRGGAPS